MPQSLAELMATRGMTPREVNFATPWQARAFGLALALCEQGAFEWKDFQQRLIAEIAEADAAAAVGRNPPTYYECWLAALESVLKTRDFVNAAEVDRRAAQIAANPPAPTKAGPAGLIKIA
jgi:nitrile hydratase accessory protein